MPSVFEIAEKNYRKTVFDAAEKEVSSNVFDLAEKSAGSSEEKKTWMDREEMNAVYGSDFQEVDRSTITKVVDAIGGTLGAAAVEVPAALASGAAAYFPSALAGSLAPIFGEDPDEWEQKVAEYMTYDPKLKESKDAMKPIHAVMEFAFKGAQVAGDKVEEETGDKRLGYATKKGVEAIIMGVIGKFIGKANEARAPKEVKPVVSRESLNAELAATETARKQDIVENFPKRERPLEKIARTERALEAERIAEERAKWQPKEPEPTVVYEPGTDVVKSQTTIQPKVITEIPSESTKVIPKNKPISGFEAPQDLTPQQKTLIDWAKKEKWNPETSKTGMPLIKPSEEFAKSEMPKKVEARVDALREKKGLRSISDIAKDINTAIGERGSIEKGKRTKNQEEAIARIKADIDLINSGKKINGRKVNGVLRPFVWENASNIVKESPELKRRVIPEKGGGAGYMENPLRVFDELGPEMKELFYWQVKDASYKITKEMKEVQNPAIKEMFKDTSAVERARVTLYGLSKQKRGGEIVKRMGYEVPELTAKELKLYKKARKWFDEWHPILVDTAKKSGTTIGKVENYIPFMHKESFLSKFGYDSFNSDSAIMDNLYDVHNRTVPYRFAKARAKTGIMPVSLDLRRIVNDYAMSSTRHKHLSPVISQLKETMRHAGIEKTTPRTNAFLNNWLDFTANPILKSNFPRPVAKGLMILNENAMFAVLSAAVRSAVIQTSAARGPLVEAGLKYTLEAVYENIKEDVNAARMGNATRAMAKSKVLLPRTYEALQYDFLNAVSSGRVRELQKIAAKAGMKPLSLLDMETAKVTWYASYKKATKDLGMTEKEAIRYSDDQVIRTQASGSPEDVAPMMRTVEGKTIGFLQTFAINEYQWLKKDIFGVGNESMSNVDRIKKLTKLIVATSIINSFYEDVLGLNSPFPAPIHAYRDAKEAGKNDADAIKQVAWEMIGMLPLLTALRYNTAPVGTPGLLAKQIIEERPFEFAGTVIGVPGTSQAKKMIRTGKRGGTPYKVIMGAYIPKSKKKKKRKKIGGGLGAL